MSLPWLVAAIAALVIAGLLYVWWQRSSPPVAVPEPAVTSPVTAAPPAASAPASAPQAAVPEPAAASQPVAVAGIDAALQALLGREAVVRFLQLDDFARRVVATTDNLPRSQAASRLWPVQRTPGRIVVTERDGKTFIDPANATRYAPLVALVESVDPARAADLYVRLLPVLQQAYEELGFPRDRFHARVMRVIDHLLAAPTPTGPVELRLTEVRGSVESERPWVRYEHADSTLEQASAGHKIMVRIGADHAQRLKAWLRSWQAELAQRSMVVAR